MMHALLVIAVFVAAFALIFSTWYWWDGPRKVAVDEDAMRWFVPSFRREPENPTWEDAAAMLEERAKMPDDWDDCGSKAPSEQLIAKARLLLSHMKEQGYQPPSMVILWDDTIHFEYYGKNASACVNVDEHGQVEEYEDSLLRTASHDRNFVI